MLLLPGTRKFFFPGKGRVSVSFFFLAPLIVMGEEGGGSTYGKRRREGGKRGKGIWGELRAFHH